MSRLLLAAALLWSAIAIAAPAALTMARPQVDGAIAGRVCSDVDGDGACADAEPGLSGIRLVLETGLWVLTDAAGRYHLAAVEARAPDELGGGRLLPGRHRLRLDERGLPSGVKARRPSVTVELPAGALVRQDFPLSHPGEPKVQWSAAGLAQPPSTLIDSKGVRFWVGGQAAPLEQVTVQGQPAAVEPGGRYQAQTELQVGSNELLLRAVSPSGSVRLSRQRVDVIHREGGILVVPRAVEPTATLQLPAGPGEKASTGPGSIRVRSLPGTRIGHPGGELVVGPEGEARVPIELRDGDNALTLRIEREGQPPGEYPLVIPAAPRPFAVGLLDLEGTFSGAGLRLFGRGAAHARHRLGDFELSGELELTDTDLSELENHSPALLSAPRHPQSFQRELDPEDYPIEWADDSVTLASNPSRGRLRLEVRHPGYGTVAFGSHRASFAQAEVGRYQRGLFGPSLDLHAGSGRISGGVRGFFDSGQGDPVAELGLAPAHEELRATGGSLYYLGSPWVSRGSEVVRLELRDGLTGVPLRERHLARGQDYEIDYRAGRIVLARPLSFVEAPGFGAAEPLTSGAEPVLVVDYERVVLAQNGPDGDLEGRRVAGGEVYGALGPVSLSAGGVQEDGNTDRYRLLRGQASAPLGPLALLVEAASSQGRAISADGFGLSDDGGLTFLRPLQPPPEDGAALGLRLRGPGLWGEGFVDAAYRLRTPGFSDGSHEDRVRLRQVSVRAEQPVGQFRLALLADDRVGADPRDPFGSSTTASRLLGARVGWHRHGYGLSLEGRDTALSAAPTVGEEALEGGRTSLGLSGHYRVVEQLVLHAGHQQVLATRGDGPGAFDNSFTSAGADLDLGKGALVGVRGGWGPRLGTQVWGQGQLRRGREVHYGGYSVDVDGPSFGGPRAVSGARTSTGEGSALFVEDVAAHDANALRMSRAVGFSGEVGGGLELTGRYERGVRAPLEVPSALTRDAAALGATWVGERFRLFGRAELRAEEGPVSRTQRLIGLGGEAALTTKLRASGRANFSDTHQGGVLEAKLLEGVAGLAWRFEGAMVVARYSIQRELAPQSRGDRTEKSLQVLSLLPSLRLGSRFSVGAGAHAGWSDSNGDGELLWTLSVRPALAVIGGLEVALEALRRSADADGQSLTAFRAEAGYRFNEQFLMAVGTTLYGFTGSGLPGQPEERRDRVYLRAEAAY